VGLRLNPPPNWPPVPGGVTPESGWQPDPSWPQPPPGWQLWVNDDQIPGSPYPYAGPYAGPGQPPPPPLSVLSVLSLVFSIVGFVPASFVLAIMALRRIGRRGERGRGLAVASLIVSTVWVVIIGLGILGTVLAKPGPSGNIKKQEAVGVYTLIEGDCFDNPAAGQNLLDVTGLPCSKPHDAQVFAVYKLTGANSAYPGSGQIAKEAQAGCNARDGNINQNDTTSSMKLGWLYPVQLSWQAGHRTVTCFIINPTKTLTSSVLNAP
jgi:hypothetical protein